MSVKFSEKKCKGIGKAFGYNSCGNVTVYRKYGLCPHCLADWISETENGKEYLKSLQITSKNRLLKKEKFEFRQKKEAIKSKSYFEKQLEKEVNKIVRLTDFSKGCISCEHGHIEPFTRKADAGHYISVGSNPTLRFNFDNIHKQCSICNTHLSANITGYQNGITKRYGEEYLVYIKLLPVQYKLINLSISELKEATIAAKNIVKQIENGKDFTRKELNRIMNIYK
jgi:hypothetical protein